MLSRSFRAARAAAMVGSLLVVCGQAVGHDKYTFTPISAGLPTCGPVAPARVNGHGAVAGSCQWTNSHGFVVTPGGASTVLAPGGNTIFMSVSGLNDAGQVVFDGCVPPPGGNGTCGPFLARYTPGAGSVRIDNLIGGPVGITNWPVQLNAAGSVAVASRGWDAHNSGSRVFVYSDAGGWQNLSALLTSGATPDHALIDFNDAGQALVCAGYHGATYLHTPGVGMTLALPSTASAADMNNSAQITGSSLFANSTEQSVFRAAAGGAVVDLDPARMLDDPRGVAINDNGDVVGFHRQGFFMFSDANGLVDLGVAGHPDGTPSMASNITSLNARGEFTGFELTDMYQTVPVVKLVGQPLRRVQDEIDPLRTRIEVDGVTGLNDSGQLVAMGRVPGTQTQISLLVTPRGCVADFDVSGSVGVQDIFSFLGAYFGGEARADIDGATGVSVGDIFAFLEAYFRGCEL